MTRSDVLKLALWVGAAALLAHLGLSAGTIWSYGPINYDDPQVLEIVQQKSVGEILSGPTYYAYKPLYFLSLKLDTIFGEAAVPFGHGVNWILHGLAAFLLVLLLYDIFQSRWIAAAAGLLFAVHPVHVENVAWYAERKDVLSLVFVLWAHRAFRADRTLGRRVALLPAVLLLLGGLTKGTVWSYAGVLFVDEWLAMARARKAGEAAPWQVSLLRLAPVLLVGIGGVVLDLVVASSSGAAGVDHGVGTSELMAAMAGVHTTYLQHLLVPVGLSLDYAVDPAGSWGSPLTLLGVVLALGAIAALVVGLRRGRALVAFAGACWSFGLAPVNNVYPRTAALMADRYLYIPAIGFYLLLAALLLRTKKSARTWILAAAVILLAILCELRTSAFATSERIWSDAIEKVPTSALAYIQRGTDRSGRGMHKAAREDANAALALEPRPEFRVRAHLLRCQSFVGLGTQAVGETRDALIESLLDEANVAARAADGLARNEMVRDDPSHVRSMAQNYIGNALEMQGDLAGARDAYHRAVQLEERNANAWMNYGTTLLKSRDERDHAEAVEALRQARDLAPGRLDIVLQLALAHGTRGDAKRAMAMLERAEARHGESAELLYTRATVLLRVAQDWNQARTILRRLREVDANHPKGTALEADIEVAIGRSRLRKGRAERDVTLLKQAIDHFDEALKVLPGHWQAHVYAGDAFSEQGRYGEARRRYKEARKTALRETWLAGLIARTAALEAAVGGRATRTPEEVRRSAEIMLSALDPDARRLDLGFAALQDELILLREL
ncbi:MAG: tetratricopeptide repeat protein, partial [Planctomycetota bacterium]|nr:tetratricopeptide repeat protein [Planctomycetota bacterium]